jgi:hypothetical protein
MHRLLSHFDCIVAKPQHKKEAPRSAGGRGGRPELPEDYATLRRQDDKSYHQSTAIIAELRKYCSANHSTKYSDTARLNYSRLRIYDVIWHRIGLNVGKFVKADRKPPS